jgi:major membrane immunogen (membrane-anchored lipoprotein)
MGLSKPSESSKAGDEDNPEDPGKQDDPSTPEEPSVKLVDGVYTGHAFCEDLDDPRAWSAYYLLVDVEVVNGKVARVFNARADSTGEIDPRYVYDSSQNATYLNFAIKGVGKRILGMIAKMQEKLDIGADPTVVDVVSSATWSSKAIVEAYKNALANIPTASESS